MSTQTVAEARAFVRQANLPAPPPEVLGASIAATSFDFHAVKVNEATLHHHSGKVRINSSVLGGVREDIAKKLAAHTREFVAGLDV